MLDKNEVFKARKLFLEKNVTNREFIRDNIYFSWMRCKLHNVNYSILDYGKFISGINMRKSFDRKYNLLIDKIESLRLNTSEICVVNFEGKIIYYKTFGHKSVFRLLNDFNEEIIGTNAIGLSIISKRNEITIAAEHYNRNLVNYISESFVYYDKYSNTDLIIGLITEEDRELIHKSNSQKVLEMTSGNRVNSEVVNQLTEEKCESNEKKELSNKKGCKLLTLKEIERNAIEETLIAVGWNMQEAAKILDIGRSTLYRKVKEYKLGVSK